jgi:hypothetical protein
LNFSLLDHHLTKIIQKKIKSNQIKSLQKPVEELVKQLVEFVVKNEGA